MSEGLKIAWVAAIASILAAVLGAILGRPVINEVAGTTDRLHQLAEDTRIWKASSHTTEGPKEEILRLDTATAAPEAPLELRHLPHTPQTLLRLCKRAVFEAEVAVAIIAICASCASGTAPSAAFLNRRRRSHGGGSRRARRRQGSSHQTDEEREQEGLLEGVQHSCAQSALSRALHSRPFENEQF